MTNPLGDVYRIDNFNDTFALGHYARVMDALDRRSGKSVAFKVLRPEHMPPPDGDIPWEVRAFANEADLLMKLAESPFVVDLRDCGYLSGVGEAPAGGEIHSFNLDVMGFAQHMRDYVRQGWRPYLSLENLPRSYNLLYLMKPNAPGVRRRLPTEEGLALALQFAELLRTAHQQGIVYMDHKLEHVYWDGMRLRVIDLNSSRQLDPASDTATQFRTDIHNLCVGILYPAFTGLSPVKASLRPQPGGMQQVETRYSNVMELDFGAEPTLSTALVSLLQRGAAIQIPTVDDFINQLQEVASLHGWDFAEYYTSPTSREARTQMRAGLARLREGQEKIREARDLFREAAIREHITEDLEDELRRLVKAVNDALNSRVIP